MIISGEIDLSSFADEDSSDDSANAEPANPKAHCALTDAESHALEPQPSNGTGASASIICSAKDAGFFERNTELAPEIIEGVIREKQLGAYAGPFGIGKTPLLNDIAMHVIYGIPWCGCRVQRRPVIHFDMKPLGQSTRPICGILRRG